MVLTLFVMNGACLSITLANRCFQTSSVSFESLRAVTRFQSILQRSRGCKAHELMAAKCELEKAGLFFRFRCSSSLFFCLFGKSRSLPFCLASLKKLYAGTFRAQINLVPRSLVDEEIWNEIRRECP